MRRRTQNLTAREHEVLELVRQGLTNDEIADRLSITSDSVKYHVTQILTKLGVSSRHEAVSAVYEERKGWPWSKAFVPTALKLLTAATAVGLLTFVGLLLWGVLQSDDSSDVPDVSGLTVSGVIGSVEEAATRQGQVLHSRIEATRTLDGQTIPYYTTELWVDSAHETVRYDYRRAPESYQYDAATGSTAIIAGKYSYVQDSPGKAYRYDAESTGSGEAVCAGVSSIWMAVLLNCGSSTAPSPAGEPRVEASDFHGRGAIVIVYGDTDLPSIDPSAPHPTVAPVVPRPPPVGATQDTSDVTATIKYSWRIYLDNGSYLPIGYTYAQVDDQGFGVSVEATYENEFVPLDQDTQTLLDPSSIGYGVSDANQSLDQIATRVPVYWLGEEFSGSNGLADLVLTRVLVGEQQGGVQQVYPVGGELVYTAPDGYPSLDLFLWRKTDWDDFLQTTEGRILTDPTCAQSEQLEVDGATATVYMLPTIQFPDTGETPVPVPIGQTPAVVPEKTYVPAPGESACNFQRRLTALVDRIVGVVQFGDVVVELRQDGYAPTQSDMRLLMQQIHPR